MPVAIPEPKSSDLQSPVPNDQANLPSIDDIASHFAKPLPQAPEAQPQVSPDDIAAHFGQAQPVNDPNAPVAGAKPLFDKDMGSASLPELANSFPQAYQNLKQNFKELGAVALGSLGTPEDKMNFAKKVFGDKNVRQEKDGKIFFRDEGDKNFRPLTGRLNSWSNFLNFVADHADVAIQGGAMAAGSVGGVPGIAAGAAAGSLAQSAIKDGAQAILGTPPTLDESFAYQGVKKLVGDQNPDPASTTNQLIASGLKAAESGAGAALGGKIAEGAGELAKDFVQPIFSKVGDYGNQIWKAIYDTTPGQRLQQVTALKQGINGIVRDTGTLFGATDEAAGYRVASKLSQIQEMHESRVDVLKDEMQKETNGEPFKIDLDPVKDFLKKKGFQTGPALVEDPGYVADAARADAKKALKSIRPINSEEGLSFDDVTATPLREEFIEPAKRQHILDDGLIHDPSLNLARESNQGNVKSLINRMNQIEVQNKDGFDYRTLDNTIGALKTGADFTDGVPHSTELQGIYQNVYGLLSKERDRIIAETASQSENEALKSVASSAMKDYHDNINNLKTWTDQFQKTDAARFSKQLISKTDSQNVAQLKQVLMSDDEGKDAWQTLKGRWLSNIFAESSDNPNFPSGKAIIKELESYSPEVRDQMFDKVEYTKMKVALEKMDKIKTKDFVAKAPDIDAAKFMAQGLFGGAFTHFNQATSAGNYVMYQILSKNAALADYMANKGFFDLAEKAPSFAEKTAWTNAAKTTQTYLSNSEKVAGENGIDRYEPGPELKTLFGAVLAHNGIDQKEKQTAIKQNQKAPTVANIFGKR